MITQAQKTAAAKTALSKLSDEALERAILLYTQASSDSSLSAPDREALVQLVNMAQAELDSRGKTTTYLLIGGGLVAAYLLFK